MNEAELINTSIRKGVSFYCIKEPSAEKSEFGASLNIIHGLTSGGFVCAPFSLKTGEVCSVLPDLSLTDLLSLPDRELAEDSDIAISSTTRGAHRKGVEGIVEKLKAQGFGKTVLSRIIVGNNDIDCGNLFQELCERYPLSTTFCFRTPASGLWIGASPELLLRADKDRISSMALAGTRPYTGSSQFIGWDPKNIEEQQLVADFISDCFRHSGFNPIVSKPFTKAAGPVEHICTEISAEISQKPEIKELFSFLKTLSPTPALCGTPRENSLKLIGLHETHDRGFYGGFFGLVKDSDDFSFYVNLRSMRITKGRFCIYAGGGITRFSDPDTEWEETERKASSLLCLISEPK